ncbi:MAG TPA: LamG domain-containing protein [Candidatus Pacearchaeota archaeon]|nr:LamG domain-containing protein [Candidatus Pacearchaeota archaeon]HQM24588.1 LamG domain-containing protein [Candidatus Pacearchaeota archaeon]
MNKSFTLIEILVVIVVIGTLSAFVLVGMNSITNSANIAKAKAFVDSLDNSLLLARVSQWKLDETSGVTANDSWGINNGTWSDGGLGIYTSPSWRTSSECVSNGCIALDGTDDRIMVPDSDTLDTINAITISIWIKPNNSIRDIINKWNGVGFYSYALSGGTGAVTRIHISQDGTNYNSYLGSKAIPLNSFNHLVVSFTNQKINFYLNGIFDVERIASQTSIYPSTTEIRIGGSRIVGYFDGLFDDVRIYNQVLSTSQIEQIYFIGLNKLFQNQGITLIEFNQRLGEIKSNLSQTGF